MRRDYTIAGYKKGRQRVRQSNAVGRYVPFRGYRCTMLNPQIQKSGETKTKGSKSGKNPEKSQFQAVIEI